MSKRVYISADYALYDGDRDVVEELHTWGKDSKHKVDYIDTALVVSGSISNDPDCRPCDLKKEFNEQINVSSAVIFVVGDKTSSRTAGSSCNRNNKGMFCSCTPYKQNANGASTCKIYLPRDDDNNVNFVNSYSYLKHEFMQAEKKGKTIIIVYNSFYHQPGWLPSYMKEYEYLAHPFWKKNVLGDRVGDYQYIKEALGYE